MAKIQGKTVYGYAFLNSLIEDCSGERLSALSEELVAAGADKFVSDVGGGKNCARVNLKDVSSRMVFGDKIIVSTLSQLGRNIKEISELVDTLVSERGCVVHIMDLGVIDAGAAGKVLLNALKAFSAYEKEQTGLSFREGRQKAMASSGSTGGRPPKYSAEQRALVLRLRNENLSVREIAKQTGIPRSSVCRLEAMDA